LVDPNLKIFAEMGIDGYLYFMIWQ